MTITGQGWELLVERLGLHAAGSVTRTYGRYQLFRNGVAADPRGHMCECPGPGDNAVEGSGLRIAPGRYPLWTQFGRFRTIGYRDSATPPGADPMPALRLEETGNRVAILIHPGHPPTPYLSSVGCLNPIKALAAGEPMDFADSRDRVIAMIDDLRAFSPGAFASATGTRIENAWVIIVGEPMDPLAR
ncbi:MAG: hypothetical protein ABI306_10265 [Caulobacteraceae bacterium]